MSIRQCGNTCEMSRASKKEQTRPCTNQSDHRDGSTDIYESKPRNNANCQDVLDIL